MNDAGGEKKPKPRQSRRHNRKKHRECKILAKCEKVTQNTINPTLSQQSSLDAIIFNEMCDKADKARENENNKELVKEGCRKTKRCLKLLRGFDKDLKLDIAAAGTYTQFERSDQPMPSTPNNIKIETRNRFRSLCSKPVDIEEKFNESQDNQLLNAFETEPILHSPRTRSLKEREIFHDTFSILIRLGSTDKERSNCHRQMSREESRWQNELKDLIWLELQAHKADRSPMSQDEYLCKQREAVGPLIKEIIEYRYNPITSLSECGSAASSNKEESTCKLLTPSSTLFGICTGCLSMYCRVCARVQIDALKQVEALLARLEAAEALFPSSQAFGSQYPLYKSSELTGRVKAMCLWYNMTKHHRLKLLILGKLLMMLHTKKKHDDTADSGFSSQNTNIDYPVDQRQSLVRFEVPHLEETSSPSDSNNSTGSHSSSFSGLSFGRTYSSSSESAFSYTEEEKLERLDFYLMEFDRQAYRMYIEDVLKTRGLRKSLNFLERLHTSVLRKARLALEKPQDDCDNSVNEEYEGDQELKRYGAWSKEAKELNLPSYRAAFVFLSRVPLDVIHEFLRIRLEQKPDQPSPLSVRQLMRELREGLRIACIHRDRFSTHSSAAMAFEETSSSFFQQELDEFDGSLKAVFEVYIDYLKQWVEMVNHDSFHKNLIMDEWNFVKSIAAHIVDGYSIAGKKFCEIVQTMIGQVMQFLTERPEELKESQPSNEDDEWSTRFHWMSVGREWQGMFVEAREKVVKSVNLARCVRREIEQWPDFNDDLKTCIVELKDEVLDLRRQIVLVIQEFQNKIDNVEEPKIESDCLAFRTRVREILHQAYRMGFECHKELCRLFLPEERAVLARGLVNFAFLWMDFVRTRCERGRGLRPRWANPGLEFLMTVCEPLNTKHLTDEEFEELKNCMDRCISHVIGSASSPGVNSDNEVLKRIPHSRASSPSQSRSRTSSFTQKARDFLKSPEISSILFKKSTSQVAIDENSATSENIPSRQERIWKAVQKVDILSDERLRSKELIGQVADRKNVDKIHIKAKRVTFTWQRGIKIGQGRFGKVYTVVNNQTGELLAMKEVQLQPGDHRAIKRVAEELQIFEGIQHQHLVHYHGLEVHREEMLIFMEFCAEGTLESLVAGSGTGLPEPLVRKYSHQMLLAVSVLHSHGIVHRDIKTANIFLTDEGNCLKLGDFGSAVQIKAHTTMPGELQGFVGTQAYMAPEIFMKSESSGHGRAADIWSVGCCIVEMSNGRRPWSEFDSNYQIMFKVGMGESPSPPKNLSQEGVDLIKRCLQHDAKKRPTANSLLSHPFARIYEDVNADLSSR